jgi:hypothetical protein
MKTSQDKVLATLANLVPEDAREKFSSAISDFLKETVADLEAQYETKLEEAYSTLTEEKAAAERVAEQGYAEAFQVICDWRDRVEVLKEEYDNQLISGYEDAYKILLAERKKKDTLEVELHEEYDNRFNEVKNFIVDKVDAFLALKGNEFYDMAVKEVTNDPAMAEHKVALDRIMEVAAHYLSNNDFAHATNSKVEEMNRLTEEMKGQIKILEARNMRLTTENQKLNEVARQAQDVLNEGAKLERTARKEMAKKVQGRGQIEMENVKDLKVIAEHQTPDRTGETDSDDLTPTQKLFKEWQVLAAIPGK